MDDHMLDEIKKRLHFLSEAMKDKDDENTVEVVVGKLPDELAERFQANREKERKLEKKISFELKQKLMEIEYEMQERFEEKARPIYDEHKALWQEVYEAFNLDPDARYGLDMTTKLIRQKLKTDEGNRWKH